MSDTNELKLNETLKTELAAEGLITAVGGDVLRAFTDPISEIKGWFEGIDAKQRHIREYAAETIQWLKDEDYENKGLSLDMGTFKTWLKTSETFYWRYYFVLNDKVYNDMMSAIKKGDITQLEYLTDFEISDRTKVTRLIDSIKDVKGLIALVEKYRTRCDAIFAGMKKRKTSIKGFPFQVLLLGFLDLNRTVKKIVNLAS